MFPGVGTVINFATIIFGAGIGVLVGSKLSLKTRDLLTDVLGLTTLLGAASALKVMWSSRYIESLPTGWTLLVVLLSLLIGGFIGSAARLEDRLDGLGQRLRIRFGASAESHFVEGFVSASLLFAIGPLAILGSISDGMSTGIDQLLLKSSLDFFAAMAFAATLGWGVALSAFPVAIYQGIWTIIGLGLGSILLGYQVDAMTVTGGLMLVAIGLKLLKIKSVAVGNLLPALLIAPVLALAVHSLSM
ncbi:MAG: DUF554 family protein [Actinobacteria bacterium]|uniref:Unannotated protein n=1 Tax=freshwater metagenome TaxID=449393 RepID=A0A6J6MHE0_9ZZZZ|nr:DUF554 family protein [Actinomycetota bacterium]MSX24541.1 DUF554 family protein [Actinomycetota bacterium]MSY46954.1 DUF554 family protein [Actinomycetota bacterium]MTB00225.1 DUF554 family protein [Actinomycetota bacterium]